MTMSSSNEAEDNQSKVMGSADLSSDMFPEQTPSYILQFQFSTWYPKFSSLSLKSTIIRPLEQSFKDYLDADGVFVPAGSEDFPAESTLSDGEDEGEKDDSDSEDGEDLATKFSFPDLDEKIRDCVQKFDGGVFPKLNFSSPRDAAWILPSSSPMKCTTPADVYLMLKSSDFVTHDLSPATVFDGCTGTAPYELELVLRKWYAVDRSRELRCFVRNNTLIGISQRDPNFYEFLNEKQTYDTIRSTIEDFWEQNVRDSEYCHGLKDYIFDFYLTKDFSRGHIIDFNPYAPRTDPLLFSYEELHELSSKHQLPSSEAVNGSQKQQLTPELRVIDSHAHPAASSNVPTHQHNMVPYEALSLSSGRDIEEFSRINGLNAVSKFSDRVKSLCSPFSTTPSAQGRMLILPGSSSIPRSKRDAILQQIQKICPEITSIDAKRIHLVKCTSADSEKELSDVNSQPRKVLDRLFAYGDDYSLEGTTERLSKHENVVFVTPRPGSITPWSSKATDIAVICNLSSHVERLERGAAFVFTVQGGASNILQENLPKFANLIHDRMTESVQLTPPDEDAIFAHGNPKPLRIVDLINDPTGADAKERLVKANKELGLALAPDEINYLIDAYITGSAAMNRNPSDAELFMFAQVNSEHCRHKIFNASWKIDDVEKDNSLFQMIRNTEKVSPTGTVSAYSDNAAVFNGPVGPRFYVSHEPSKGPNPDVRNLYTSIEEEIPILVKVETHNHPTAVSPYPGAATGSGGEIRDEGAVGRGSKPKAGLAGFTVSNLLIPGYEQPWETDFGRPSHIASAFDIMIEGPLGAAAFNNEFGRPALAGYFRTFAESVPISSDGKEREVRGYHKPIMIAGGYGNVRPQFSKKDSITPGAKIVVLGGPGLLIGLGGGAASSQVSGESSAELDFASVQRDNPEMQRRCQQVIDACVALGDLSPIESIHDVGAGGLSNALPELVHDSDLGGKFEIRDVLVADSSMSPMEIWCNESQERYVLAVSADKIEVFESIAKRERCHFSVVGVATSEQELIVTDRLQGKEVINLKMSTLFGKPPKMSRTDVTRSLAGISFDTSLSKYLPEVHSASERLSLAVNRVLRLPSVGSKSFLITIGDRSITGLVSREQMVGPWQVPVADVAVTRSTYGFDVKTGEAMAMGERTPVALLHPAASARMAVAESLMNLTAATVGDLSRVKLSANWMCAASKEGEGAGLYEAVQAVGMELCPALGVGIPVGKDSMSMSMKWKQGGEQKEVSSPLSLIVTAFAPVDDVTSTWTPQLRTDVGEKTCLVFCDLANGRARLGCSALAQVFKEIGSESPDVESPMLVKAFFEGCQKIKATEPGLVLAYHDRSDGGLFTTIVEMSFAGHVGAEITLDSLSSPHDVVSLLFNEELGAVVQVKESQYDQLVSAFANTGFPSPSIHLIGYVNTSSDDQNITIIHQGERVFSASRGDLQEIWSETSFKMQTFRDDPTCAQEEFGLIKDESHSGLFYDLKFEYHPSRDLFRRPKVAILREQGVNGQTEMAWSFTAAGFDAVDVHMSDILSASVTLADFVGFAACGGFSYGDVLGAGKGWANSALLNEVARKEFSAFFQRENTFTLGVCNGCQFLSHLREIIPGAEDWPDFKTNRSERFEGRTSMVEIVDNEISRSSIFFREMVGSKLPVAVAHGEGRVAFTDTAQQQRFEAAGLVAARYIDAQGRPTEVYPLNPNGSPGGITGISTPNGRVLALMPHPERVTNLDSNSWYPPFFVDSWKGTGPWFRMFQSARKNYS